MLLAFSAGLTLGATAQKNAKGVEIQNADTWEFDGRRVPGAQILKGNVRFRHASATMSCDSAYLYEDQRVDAFGNVTINEGDSLFVHGDRLRYDARERMARVEGNVRLRNADMELTTPSLDYDLGARRGMYNEGGRIESHTEQNVLTSRTGTYLADERTFIFGRNVRLDHPHRTITGDTMHYLTPSGVALFFGPTRIVQDSTVITTLRGLYDTREERARFTRRTTILSRGRTLEGDSIHYERRSGIGLAWGHVTVSDTSGEMVARGDKGSYDERKDRSMITGHAELVLLMDGDSLFLHSDTLFARPDSSGQKRLIQAHRHVRFYKSDLQGACDTLIHSEADSTIHMFNKPVLWNENDQITGDRIRIAMRNGQAHRLYVDGSAFLMAQVDSGRFDQVTGTHMTGSFADNTLRRIDAEGNARTVYFAQEEKDGVKEVIGVNRADCSRIGVTLEDGQVSTVTFLERPTAVLYPIDKAPPEELRMKGALWRGDERPTERADIFRRPDETTAR
jgi:lipopolysaccharide export system protein LptA